MVLIKLFFWPNIWKVWLLSLIVDFNWTYIEDNLSDSSSDVEMIEGEAGNEENMIDEKVNENLHKEMEEPKIGMLFDSIESLRFLSRLW